jgi:hypothetical protein
MGVLLPVVPVVRRNYAFNPWVIDIQIARGKRPGEAATSWLDRRPGAMC